MPFKNNRRPRGMASPAAVHRKHTGSGRPHVVVGFMVCYDFGVDLNVLLIEKKRPEWQAGKLNGLGGKVLPHETPKKAMSREFFEECGVEVLPKMWREFATVSYDHVVLHCFHTRWVPGMNPTSKTDEKIVWKSIYDHIFGAVEGVNWMTKMAVSTHQLKASVCARVPD